MPERPPPPPEPGAPLRAQILATEHWGLLAARTTTQNELLSRIGLLLTLLSAGLVTIGLLSQALGFGRPLATAAFGITAFVWLVGVLTLLRVLAGSEDDAVLVLGMNRIRAAYVELDPGIEQHLVDSAHDDEAGLAVTYSYFPRSDARQALGSSTVFTLLVTAVLTGLLVATGLVALDAPGEAAVAVGLVVGTAFAVLVAMQEGRRVRLRLRLWPANRPTPPR